MAGGLRGLPADLVTKRANQLLELLYLQEARWLAISNYSKGMKQRVLIAAALLHDPDVLIFDEAQSGLDITNSLLFRHLLRELAARGKAVLYISHVLELVEKICDHIVVIDQGRIVADDSVERLRNSDCNGRTWRGCSCSLCSRTIWRREPGRSHPPSLGNDALRRRYDNSVPVPAPAEDFSKSLLRKRQLPRPAADFKRTSIRCSGILDGYWRVCRLFWQCRHSWTLSP